MRTNVYAEEVTPEVELVTKEVGENTFYGVRMYLHSPEVLHHGPDDDDRSAITFWVPWTRKNGHDPISLALVLESMASLLRREVDNDRTLA